MYGVAMVVGCRTIAFHRLFVMRDDNPEALVPQQSPVGNLKSLFFLFLKICFFMIILSSNFLGAFSKWRKATLSFVMFVRPSVRMEKLPLA